MPQTDALQREINDLKKKRDIEAKRLGLVMETAKLRDYQAALLKTIPAREKELKVVQDQYDEVYKERDDLREELQSLESQITNVTGFIAQEKERLSQRSDELDEKENTLLLQDNALDDDKDRLAVKIKSYDSDVKALQKHTDEIYTMAENHRETEAKRKSVYKQQEESLNKLKNEAHQRLSKVSIAEKEIDDEYKKLSNDKLVALESINESNVLLNNIKVKQAKIDNEDLEVTKKLETIVTEKRLLSEQQEIHKKEVERLGCWEVDLKAQESRIKMLARKKDLLAELKE